MSNVSAIQANPKVLRRSARLIEKHLGVDDKPVEAIVENGQVSEKRIQDEEIPHLESNPSTPEIRDIEIDSEGHKNKIEEPPITTTPRRRVKKIRSANLKARIKAFDKAQKRAKLKSILEAVVHELVCIAAKEQKFFTVDEVVECFDRHELTMQ